MNYRYSPEMPETKPKRFRRQSFYLRVAELPKYPSRYEMAGAEATIRRLMEEEDAR